MSARTGTGTKGCEMNPGRKLPEDSGRIVLAIFRENDIAAKEAMAFHAICNAFVSRDRSVSELSEGICFLIQHGCLRRGLSDEDAFYLTELGQCPDRGKP